MQGMFIIVNSYDMKCTFGRRFVPRKKSTLGAPKRLFAK